MAFRAAVVTFPGSNCDRDLAVALEKVSGTPAIRVWHGDAELPERLDFIALPGGFSYGDYLRCGAMAARSPIVRAVVEAANRGVPVLGICNGFQVLTEAGLVPGVLRPNASLKFRCHDVALTIERESPWLPGCSEGDELTIPMKHHDGCWFADAAQVAELEARGQVLLRYRENPNGSVGSVACVTSAEGNVAALMPHPEHAVERLVGSTDGRVLLQGLLDLAGVAAPA